MKKYFPVYVRVPLLFGLFYGAIEYFIDSGDKPAFIEYPSLGILLLLFLFVVIALEIVGNAANQIIDRLMSPEEREERERKESLPLTQAVWYKNLMAKLTKSKPIEAEHELELHHDYDGIKELDNDLPPWWVYLFYGTIVFAFVYLGKYHLFGGDNQEMEFKKEMADAQVQIEEYKKTAPDLLTADQVTLLTEPSDIATGKSLFESNCVACHRADGGGGIGPNLTDEYWILGGDIKSIFNTIMEGGRDGKGMVAWKQQIKPSDIQKVASYILTLQGTNPADAKAPEGDKVEAQAVETAADETSATETLFEESTK